MVTTLSILKIFVEGTLAHSLTTKRHQWAALRHHCWVRWHQILTESLTTWAVCGSLQNKMTMMSLIKQVFRFLRYYDSYGVRSQLIPTKMIVEYCRCYSLSLQGSTENVSSENEFVWRSCFTVKFLFQLFVFCAKLFNFFFKPVAYYWCVSGGTPVGPSKSQLRLQWSLIHHLPRLP